MRSKVGRTLALALLLGGVGLVMGQTPQQPQGVEVGAKQLPKKKVRVEEEETPKAAKQKAPQQKSKLEEMLAEALKSNPDIRVAAAKLAEADAELNRTRLQVSQKVMALYYAIETQKNAVGRAELKFKSAHRLYEQKVVSSDEIEDTKRALAIEKAKLAEVEAQLPALLGMERPSMTAEALRSLAVEFVQPQVVKLWDAGIGYRIELAVPEGKAQQLEGKLFAIQSKSNIPQADKLRKALQTPVKVDYKDMTFDAILKDLAKKAEGLSFRNLFQRGDSRTMSLRFEEALPVSAILQALADETNCSFYVREYGILAISPPAAPPGAMTVEQFLRQKPAPQPGNQPAGAKNPPAGSVEGRVKAVDGSGLMTISIGSDAGLAKGQTLELYWMPHQPPVDDAHPLGKVRVLEAEAHQAVVQPIELTRRPQLGDRIIGQISKK